MPMKITSRKFRNTLIIINRWQKVNEGIKKHYFDKTVLTEGLEVATDLEMKYYFCST